MIAHHRLQAVGNLAEQGVADRVAERVVDVLEPVEIDHEQRAAFLPVRGVAQGFVERLTHHRPVGQAGQRIEAGKARNLALAAALLGQVGADAPKPEEASALVEDGVAGQRPVNVLLARRPNDDIGERETRRQMEAERLAFLYRILGFGFHRQEIGELPPEKRSRDPLEIVGELLGDVRQGSHRIGFPEPAAAAGFEFVDEALALRACSSSLRRRRPAAMMLLHPATL